ncbi:MAG: hypothetical protein ACE5JX_04645 [Acidobacteriota bacterium]
MPISDCRTRLYSLSIIAASFLYIHYGFWKRWDLPIYDGVYYFERALRWPVPDLFLNRQWSPLYIVFYSNFHWLLAGFDPFWVYAIHRLTVLGLIAFAFWRICLRFYDWWLCTVATALLIGNATLLDNFHVVHAAGLLFTLAVLWVASGDRPGPYLLPGLALCGVFMRPEFAVAFIVLLLWLALKLAGGNLETWKPGGKAGLCLLAVLGLWAISWPASGHTGRAFQAFSQQSARAAAGENSVAAGFQHRERSAGIYGGAETLEEALWANPRAFSRTIAFNLLGLPSAWVRMLSHRGGSPASAPLSLLVLMLAAAGTSGARRRPRASFWICAAAFAMAGLTAAVVIGPATLYLLPTLPLIYFGTAYLVTEYGSTLISPHLRGLVALPVGLGLVLVAGLAGSSMKSKGQPFLRFSKELAAHASPQHPVRLWAYSPESYCLWAHQAGRLCSGIGPEALNHNPDPRAVLEAQEISALVIDVAMRQVAVELNHQDLVNFEADPAPYGFQLVDETGGGLLEELLASLPWDKTARLYLRVEPQHQKMGGIGSGKKS